MPFLKRLNLSSYWMIYLAVTYALLDSLFKFNVNSILSMVVIILYIILTWKIINIYRVSLVLSISFIIAATLSFLASSSMFFVENIKRFSDWSYLFLLVGTLQLVKFVKFDK
jgi:hypothetical protein